MREGGYSEGFISDLSEPGMCHALLVRSPVSRGTILSIEGPPLPDGYLLIKAEDIPGANMLKAFGSSIPVLAELRVSYEGEPVAILAGPDLDMLHALKPEVKVLIREMPARLSFEKFSSDQVEGRKTLIRGSVEGAFAQAASVIEERYRTGAQEHYYSEPHGALASFEGEKMLVYASTQWPFHVRLTVSDLLEIDAEDIVVRTVNVASHLDGKLWYPSFVAAQAALAAFLLKKPVKLLLERKEDFLYSVKRARTSIRHKAALDAEGNLIGADIQILLNIGAYAPLADEILGRLCIAALGVYGCANLRVEAYAIATNNPPMGAFAGLGMSSAFFAMEMQAERIARAAGKAPEEWRLLKALAQGDELITGDAMGHYVPKDEILGRLCAMSDFRRKYASYELQRKKRGEGNEGSRRGIGISFCYQGNGFLDLGKEQENYAVELLLGKDSVLEIRTSAVVSSKSTVGLWKTLAAERLALPADQVKIAENSTDLVPDSGPSTLSRNITVVTNLIDKCLTEIQKRRFRDALPIAVRKQHKAARRKPAENGLPSANPFSSYSWGGAVVEVEIDEASLELRPLGVWICVDGGKIISERRARASLESGSMAALGWALAERLELTGGKVAEADFFSHGLLGYQDLPTFRADFVQVGKDGAAQAEGKGDYRGIGELPYNCVPAALAQAYAQAAGRGVSEIPLPRVWRATEAAE